MARTSRSTTATNRDDPDSNPSRGGWTPKGPAAAFSFPMSEQVSCPMVASLGGTHLGVGQVLRKRHVCGAGPLGDRSLPGRLFGRHPRVLRYTQPCLSISGVGRFLRKRRCDTDRLDVIPQRKRRPRHGDRCRSESLFGQTARFPHLNPRSGPGSIPVPRRKVWSSSRRIQRSPWHFCAVSSGSRQALPSGGGVPGNSISGGVKPVRV